MRGFAIVLDGEVVGEGERKDDGSCDLPSPFNSSPEASNVLQVLRPHQHSWRATNG